MCLPCSVNYHVVLIVTNLVHSIEASGRTFYYHPKTLESTWVPPEEVAWKEVEHQEPGSMAVSDGCAQLTMACVS